MTITFLVGLGVVFFAIVTIALIIVTGGDDK